MFSIGNYFEPAALKAINKDEGQSKILWLHTVSIMSVELISIEYPEFVFYPLEQRVDFLWIVKIQHLMRGITSMDYDEKWKSKTRKNLIRRMVEKNKDAKFLFVDSFKYVESKSVNGSIDWSVILKSYIEWYLQKLNFDQTRVTPELANYIAWCIRNSLEHEPVMKNMIPRKP